MDIDLDLVVGATQLDSLQTVWKESEFVYIFTMKGKKEIWEISIVFKPSFPYSLPALELKNTEYIGIIPHVNKSGTICLEDDDSILINYVDPARIVVHLLKEAVLLLERMSLGIYRDELLDELEGYFLGAKLVNSFYHATNKLEWIYLRLRTPKNKFRTEQVQPLMLSDRRVFPPHKFSNISGLNAYQQIKIIHFPLDDSALPPGSAGDIDSTYLYSLLKKVSYKRRRFLEKLLKKIKPARCFFVLVSMPRSSNERTQFLLKCSSSNRLTHPLTSINDGWQVETMLVRRMNKEYLLERGGADSSLQERKVAIIGCGSVGSEIAVMLAKSGVGNLALIDYQNLEADNIYRHRAGGSLLNFLPSAETYVGISKVKALKKLIQSDLPFIHVNDVNMYAEQAIKIPDIANADLIIIAVGSPSLNLWINRKLKEIGIKKAVFCWNEAAGCGGHAILLDYERTCLECLFSSETGISQTSPISLVKPGQKITKNLTGCAGSFTPFTYIDSVRTAEAACHISILNMRSHIDPIALSWKGENRSGLETTSRFDSMPLKEQISIDPNVYCQVCNG